MLPVVIPPFRGQPVSSLLGGVWQFPVGLGTCDAIPTGGPAPATDLLAFIPTGCERAGRWGEPRSTILHYPER